MILNSQGSLVGDVDATAEKAALVTDVTYLYCADVNSVIRYTTSGGSDATATVAAGDVFVPASAGRLIKTGNGNTHLSIVRRSADGRYSLTPLIGY